MRPPVAERSIAAPRRLRRGPTGRAEAPSGPRRPDPSRIASNSALLSADAPRSSNRSRGRSDRGNSRIVNDRLASSPDMNSLPKKRVQACAERGWSRTQPFRGEFVGCRREFGFALIRVDSCNSRPVELESTSREASDHLDALRTFCAQPHWSSTRPRAGTLMDANAANETNRRE